MMRNEGVMRCQLKTGLLPGIYDYAEGSEFREGYVKSAKNDYEKKSEKISALGRETNKGFMTYYNREGVFNPAYHDNETLEINRSPSRSRHYYNPYEPDRGPWQDAAPEWTPQDALPPYSEQGPHPWEREEGNWGTTDHIPMRLLPSPNGSLRWRHNQGSINSGYQADSAVHYIVPPFEEHYPETPYMGDALQQRGMSLFPGGGVALDSLGLTEEDIRDEIKSGERDLVEELVAMSSSDQIQAIRVLQMSLQDRRQIRRQVLASKSSKRGFKLTCLTDCSEQVSRFFRRFGAGMAAARQAMALWYGTMKEIGGKFGTSVLSYFLFLKWLLMFNIFSFLVNFGFITVPQLVQLPNRTDEVHFRGLELLTGAGYFNQSVLYYGGYSNETIGTQPAYDMQLAYFFTISAYMVLCGLSLIYSMARSFQKNFVLSASGNAWSLLCSWDFSITSEKAIRQRQSNLCTQLKESLSEKSQRSHMSRSERGKQFAIHLVAWLISSGLAVASCAAILFLSMRYLDTITNPESQDFSSLVNEASTLLLPFVVSLINLVIPLLYSLLNKFEKYSNPRTKIYAIILRNVLLKMGILSVLCYYWMKIVSSIIPCWESFVGQDLYRLVFIDFIFSMLETFFGEFLRKIIGTKCLPGLGVPEFDVARNVLDLIYAQTLAWIGIYFSPLLPVLQMIKLFIIFYLKKVSLYQNCQPPRRYGRAAQMQTIFIALLFFPSFVGAVSMVAYTVWSLTPSRHCGPFQGLNRTFDAVAIWMDRVNVQNIPGTSWAVWVYGNMIRSELFFYLMSLIILVCVYVLWEVTEGRKLLIKFLQEQIINEGKDKAFLLEKLRKLQREKQTGASSRPAHTQMTQSHNRMKEIEPDYEPEFHSLPGLPLPEEGIGSPGPPMSHALILAMQARRQAEEEEDDGY